MSRFLAVDLRATSGRVTAGRLERGHLDVRGLREVVRRSERVARYEPERSRVG